jgi:hypothetical protein
VEPLLPEGVQGPKQASLHCDPARAELSPGFLSQNLSESRPWTPGLQARALTRVLAVEPLLPKGASGGAPQSRPGSG